VLVAVGTGVIVGRAVAKAGVVAVGSSSEPFDEQDTAIAIKVIAAMRISAVRSGLFT
jgi:hypothetical protein